MDFLGLFGCRRVLCAFYGWCGVYLVSRASSLKPHRICSLGYWDTKTVIGGLTGRQSEALTAKPLNQDPKTLNLKPQTLKP